MMRHALRGLAALSLALLIVGPGSAQDKGQNTVKILLPERDAELKVDDAVVKGQDKERTWTLPKLEKETKFTFAAKWRPNGYTEITRTRQVALKPGADATVDLTKALKEEEDKIVVIYVPTQQDLVDEMLKLAKVGKDDVVYDLGCGDGRFVITAIKKFGAKKGYGVDIDPVRIKECIENAKKEGIADKVEFKVQDVLEIKDVSEATVVTLYMGRDLNLRMRPMLQKTLKPGARIVSNRFDMGDWEPDVKHALPGHTYPILLWRITGKELNKKAISD